MRRSSRHRTSSSGCSRGSTIWFRHQADRRAPQQRNGARPDRLSKMGRAAGYRAADQADAAKDRRDRGATRLGGARLRRSRQSQHGQRRHAPRRRSRRRDRLSQEVAGRFQCGLGPSAALRRHLDDALQDSAEDFNPAFTSMGETAEEASQNSLDYCNREKGGGTCQTRDAICAAGASRRLRAMTVGTSRSTLRPRSRATSRSATIRITSPPTHRHLTTIDISVSSRRTCRSTLSPRA